MRKVAQLAYWLTTILAVSLCSTVAQSAIIGIGNYANVGPGILYSVDTYTGAVNPVGSALNDQYFPISAGPSGGYFALSPVNHYLVSYPSGPAALWECYLCGAQSPSAYTGDYAYDSSNGKIFSALVYSGSSIGNFAQMNPDGPIPGYPGSVFMVPAPIGLASSDFNLSLIMEYIQGLGLYATDGQKAFLINENSGAETPLPSLFYAGPKITGLAYDPYTGQLIGTGGMYNAFPGATGYIYSINPLTGTVTTLNSNAPNMIGLAPVPNPEPSTVLLLAAGLCCLWRMAGRRPSRLLRETGQ